MSTADDLEPSPDTSVRKACCMCGTDLADSKRIRDSSGRYWCESCVKLDVRERHAIGVAVCPDCGTAGVTLVEQDDLKVCEPCAGIRKQEIVDAETRRKQKAFDPELQLRRVNRFLLLGFMLFATVLVLRFAVWHLKFEHRIDDWLNVLAIAAPVIGMACVWMLIGVKRKMRLIEYNALLERVENGILAMAERHNQTQTVIERTEGLRVQARRAIRRIEAAAGRGVENADKLIQQFDLRHESSAMVGFLEGDREGAHDLVSRNREIETLAYLDGDYNTAMDAVSAVLLRIPSELDGLTRQALILCALGKFDLAKKIFIRIINQAEKKDDLLAEADGYANLGLVHQLLDQIDDAHKYHNKALFMYKKLTGNEDREADCYGNIGFIHHRRGESRDAELVFRKALEINSRLDRVEGMAMNYGVLGLMVYNSPEGRLSEADSMLRKAVTLNDKIARFGAVAAAYGNLGLVKAKAKDFKKARQMLLTALSIYQRLNRQKMVHKVQTMLTQLSKTAPAK